MLTAYAWTCPAPTTGVTTTLAVHITEMRIALNHAYVAAGKTPPTYTDAVLAPNQTVIKAVHIVELRNAAVALE